MTRTMHGNTENQTRSESLTLLPVVPAPVSIEGKVVEATCYEGVDDDYHIDSEIKKGNNAANPLIKGCPFWTVCSGEEEEMTDDDYPVDIETIEKVMNNPLMLKKHSHAKKKFDAFQELTVLEKSDILFTTLQGNKFSIKSFPTSYFNGLLLREQIYAHTISSVLSLFNGSMKNLNRIYSRPPSELKRVIGWSETITVTTFDADKRNPKSKFEATTEAMRDIVRSKEGLEKEPRATSSKKEHANHGSKIMLHVSEGHPGISRCETIANDLHLPSSLDPLLYIFRRQFEDLVRICNQAKFLCNLKA
uniref:DNA-directed RNA polymerase n=1 Tax=Heterorhabditis bacteriophora TaxID=37862 RepID=A0A1I7X501_HETBA